jgi:hypothetical protein
MKTLIRAFRARRARLRFRREVWETLISELGRRGSGTVESGAFLLAARGTDGRTITRIVYFDDLDPDCLKGHIHIDGSAFPRLWDICDEEELRVVGDVHTHGGAWVEQSPVDRDNPMVARGGHLGLIVPHLAQRRVGPAEIGVHEYLGDAGWRSHTGRSAARLVYVGRWA